MVTDTEKERFSARLNSALDAIEVPPKGHGRQIAVAQMFDVSQKGARKWLEAESMPATWRIPGMARRLEVYSEWLLSGDGPRTAGDKQPARGRIAEDASDYGPLLDIDVVHKILDSLDQERAKRGDDEIPNDEAARVIAETYPLFLQEKKSLQKRRTIIEAALKRAAGTGLDGLPVSPKPQKDHG